MEFELWNSIAGRGKILSRCSLWSSPQLVSSCCRVMADFDELPTVIRVEKCLPARLTDQKHEGWHR